jgi:hypothetical protein
MEERKWEGVRVLVDSGAERNLVSQVFARHLHLIPSTPINFVYADGSSFCSSFVSAPLCLSIDDYVTTLPLRVCALSQVDVILGREWLERENPSIDWRTGEICVEKGGKKVMLRRPRATPSRAEVRRVAAQEGSCGDGS